MDQEVIRITEAYLDKRWPTAQGSACLMIIVDGFSEDELLAVAGRVGDVCRDNRAAEIFVAETPGKQRTVLKIQSQIYEALREQMLEILDISVSPSHIVEYVRGANAISREVGIWLPTYGHAADGNVHTHIMKAAWKSGVRWEIDGWQAKYPAARDRLHDLGRSYGGTISGEHGIGLVKKDYLSRFLGAGQVALMKAIKASFDPKGILNPGKVL